MKDYGFEVVYDYNPDELQYTSGTNSISIEFNGSPLMAVELDQELHSQFFTEYKQRLETKLNTIQPYLSGIESFLVMVSDLYDQSEIELFVKKEIYTL